MFVTANSLSNSLPNEETSLMQRSLFESSFERSVLLDGGWISLTRKFVASSDSGPLFTKLREEVRWEVSIVTVFGQQHPIPRMNAWYGDEGAVMTYSNTRFEPHPMTTDLQQLSDSIGKVAETTFNSVLANLYRSGLDRMGWHADDESELGENPIIASLSLGASRKFVLKHRTTKEKQELTLHDGDLLIMGGTTQHHYVHGLPKTQKPCGERINLTFRSVAINQG